MTSRSELMRPEDWDRLAAEATENDPAGTSARFANLNPDEQRGILVDAATWRSAVRAKAADLARPLTEAELATVSGIAGTAVPDASARPSFLSVAEIPEPFDVDDWLVEGVLRRHSLLVIGAGEGVGKSQGRTELAIRATTGTGALFGHYVIPHRLRVMALDEENGGTEEYRREAAILEALGLERSALTDYFRASFAGMVLTDAGAQAWLDGEVAAIRPDVLILDTGTSMIGDEWGAELKAAIRYVRSLIVRYGCSVVVLVHLTKPSKDRRPGAPAHGSAMTDVMGQWTRTADSVAIIADLGEGRLRWEMRKKVPPSTLILAKRSGIFEVMSIGEAPRKPSSDERVLRAIDAGGSGPDDIAVVLGLGRRTVSEAIARLRKDGFVGPGHPYELTELGRETVG